MQGSGSTSGTSPRDTPTDSPQVPKKTNGATQIPNKTNGATHVPKKTNGTAQVPKKTTESTQVPKKTNESRQVPKKTNEFTQVPKKTTESAQVPKKTTESTQVPKKTNNEPNKTTKDHKPAKPTTPTTTKHSASGNGTSRSIDPSTPTEAANSPPAPHTIAVGTSIVDKTLAPSGTNPPPLPTEESDFIKGLVHRAIQTERVCVSDRWVMTDPAPLSENFKERYEMVLREKIDLRAKLEESEDRRFKMQRDHKIELERLGEILRDEATQVCVCVCLYTLQHHTQLYTVQLACCVVLCCYVVLYFSQEAQVKVRELEVRVGEERNKGQQEKRELVDQTKSLKSEIKSLTDKVDRWGTASIDCTRKWVANAVQNISSSTVRSRDKIARVYYQCSFSRS